MGAELVASEDGDDEVVPTYLPGKKIYGICHGKLYEYIRVDVATPSCPSSSLYRDAKLHIITEDLRTILNVKMVFLQAAVTARTILGEQVSKDPSCCFFLRLNKS